MIINSESEYLIACGQLEELMNSTENEPIFMELVDAIEEYEEKNYPIDSPVDDMMDYDDEHWPLGGEI